jgi:rSAM/selenodomain-associated transferase 2/rSAM/selenodomain-associated transferase 1
MPDAPLASVIVPVWRDRDALAALIRSWTADAAVELLVAAPLGDATLYADLVRDLDGCLLVEAPRGRASQMNAGAARANGRWLLFLHADSRLPRDWLNTIEQADARGDVAGGAFRFALNSRDPRARVLERAVRLRVRLLHLPYGDQAVFARRSAFEDLGGYADLPLMEDLDFVRRLRRQGRLLFAPSPVVTSARRWERDGWVQGSVRNMMLASRFLLLGAAPARLAQQYFRRQPDAIVVMARAPWTGGKTRLEAADDGTHGALRSALFLDTLDAARSLTGADHLVACEPASELQAMRRTVPGGVDVFAQRGYSLGERMAHVFEDAFRLGHERVLVVGSDLPDLPTSALTEARTALARGQDRVVLGPATDGGYYLVGLTRPHPELFAGIDWGTGDVLSQTKAAATRAALPVDLLPEWSDVDDAAALARVAGASGSSACRTRAWIDRNLPGIRL